MTVISSHLQARVDGHVVETSKAGLLILIWTGTAVAAFFTVLRSWLQFSHNKRLFTNDLLICLALVFHIILSIIIQCLAPLLYDTIDVTDNFTVLSALPTATFEKYLKYQYAALFLIWIALWTVKLATLSFFWRLFKSVRTNARLFWWIMFGITIVTWIIGVFLQAFACSPASGSFTPSAFLLTRSLKGFNAAFLFSSIADIITDFTIMLIPFPLLRHLQMPRRKKAILLIIFLTPLIAICFAILRLTIQTLFPLGLVVNPIRLALYSTLEVSISIIAACLPSLRLYFTDQPATLAIPRIQPQRVNAQLPIYESTARQHVIRPIPSNLETGSTEAILNRKGNNFEMVDREIGH